MKTAIIGPGAMGLLYGGKLSTTMDVTMIGNNPAHIDEINRYGIVIEREGKTDIFPVSTQLNGTMHDSVDLIILFTKAYLTEDALSANQNLIGKHTFLLSLQNGMGHEEILSKFTDQDHVLIGTTAQGSYRKDGHSIVNSGLGETVIGSPWQEFPSSDILEHLKQIQELFEAAGFPCSVSDNIRYTVWNKLMINASSSVLSGVLQKPQGYVATNEWAWSICQDLIREICHSAACDGLLFDESEQIDRIKNHLKAAPDGYTSIYADLKSGRKTEVDVISGSVVKTAQRHNLSVPASELIVRLVHAMES